MKDKLFSILLWIIGLTSLVLMLGFLYSLIKESLPALTRFGFFNFYFSSVWDTKEGQESYGALSFIINSTLTALLALAFAIPFSLSLIVINKSYIRGKNLEKVVGSLVDIATTIPTIIWGIWGFYVIRPILNTLHIGNQGYGMVCSAIVLAIMIIPFAASYSSVYLKSVPQQLKENAYALGATNTEVIWKISIPFLKRGIASAHLLAFGKALGEAIIVVILIGNGNPVSLDLSNTANTMAGVLLNQAGSANDLKLSALFAIALFLFVFTAATNTLARYLIPKQQGIHIKN